MCLQAEADSKRQKEKRRFQTFQNALISVSFTRISTQLAGSTATSNFRDIITTKFSLKHAMACIEVQGLNCAGRRI
jgi:hypothetical protein